MTPFRISNLILTHQHHRPVLDEIVRLEAIEIDATGQVAGLEVHAMPAFSQCTLHEHSHPRAQHVENVEPHLRRLREAEGDRGGGIERVGIIPGL